MLCNLIHFSLVNSISTSPINPPAHDVQQPSSISHDHSVPVPCLQFIRCIRSWQLNYRSSKTQSSSRRSLPTSSPLRTELATYIALRSSISQPVFRAAICEEWKSCLNPWCTLLDSTQSFEEIFPVNIRIFIKFYHDMTSNWCFCEQNKFCHFILKNPISSSFSMPVSLCNLLTPLFSNVFYSPISTAYPR